MWMRRSSLPYGEHRLRVDLDLNRVTKDSIVLSEGGIKAQSHDHWVNPDYKLIPLMECKLVFWDKTPEIQLLKRILLKVDNKEVLDSFYKRQFEKDAYSPEHPFLDLLHHHKLKILQRLFARFFRGNVLDVGCGLSLFTAYEHKWGFSIYAGDRVHALMMERKRKRPDITWLVFDASHLPFKSNTFDSLFAGEILEHLPEPDAGMKEWNRVLRRGGSLIVTTPNRTRRINRLNRQDWPVSPDHLREFSYEELNYFLLPRSGFKVLKKKGIYLELRAKSNKWWLEDYLQREGNTRKNAWMMKLLFRLGHLFPKNAFVLISLAKKLE
jgi:ubiquinone/menaquinone biosynthesis C-methylase UbiE